MPTTDHMRMLVKPMLMLAIAVGATAALWQSGSQLGELDLTVQPAILLAAAGLVLVYRVLNACVWSQILSGLGYRVSVTQSARLWLKTEAARWLPGSVWNFGARAMKVKNLGVPLAIGALSVLAELLMTITAWAVIAFCGSVYYFPLLHQSFAELTTRMKSSELIFFGLASLAGFFLLKSRLLAVGRLGLLKLQSKYQDFASCETQMKPCMKALVAYLVLNSINGYCFWLTVTSICPENSLPVEAAIAANAAAWLVGFFAVFAPGGLVVREACLASLLSVWLTPTVAIAAAVLWRIVQIAVELFTLLAVLALEVAFKPNPSATTSQ